MIKWLNSYLFYHPHLHPPPSRGRKFVGESLQPVSKAVLLQMSYRTASWGDLWCICVMNLSLSEQYSL